MDPTRAPDVSGLDLAALAAANLTPVLGRYFERSWSHGEGHRLFDTDGRAYLDFANGIAVSVARAPPPAGHGRDPRPGRPADRPDGRDGLRRAGRPPRPRARRDAPRPARHRSSSSTPAREAIEAALKLARRVTGRPGIVAFRGGFHGRTFGADDRHDLEPQLPDAATSRSCRGSTSRQFPAVYRDFGGDEERGGRGGLPRICAPLPTDDRAGRGRGDPHRAGPGRGRLRTRAAGASCRACARSATSTGSCSSPTRSRAATPGPGGCGASSTPGSFPTSSASRRRSRTACRSRRSSTRGSSRSAGARAPTARRTAATRSPVPPASRSSRRSASDDLVANAAARGAELTAGLRATRGRGRADRRRPRTRTHDRRGARQGPRDAGAGRRTCEAVIARCADDGLLVLSCGVAHNVIRWIAPTRRDGRGDRRGARDLPGGPGEPPSLAVRPAVQPRPPGRSARQAGVAGEELHDVLEAEASVATLADADRTAARRDRRGASRC